MPTSPRHAAAGNLPSSETIRVLAQRVSVRDYAERSVDDHYVQAVLKSAFRAPTSSNIQSYSVIVVREAETLAALGEVTAGQRHVREAPVFIGFCADLTRIEAAMAARGHCLEDNNLEVGLVASIDAALVGMSAYLAAESLGLKGVLIGAVRNNAVETARILGLPKGVYCVFGMVLGWPGEVPAQKPRMAYDDMVHYERYGRHADEAGVDERVAAYDAVLAAHYEAAGKPTTPDSWSHDMDKKFNPQLRDNLRAELAALGFDFR